MRCFRRVGSNRCYPARDQSPGRMKDRANPGVRVLAKLPNDNRNGLIHNLWNPVYVQKSPDRPNTPSRSISMSITGFGSRVTLTSSSGVPIPKTSLIGSHKGLISPSRSLEIPRASAMLLTTYNYIKITITCYTFCIVLYLLHSVCSLHNYWHSVHPLIARDMGRTPEEYP